MQVPSAAGTRTIARSPPLPLLRLVLSSVLLLLDAHYCWSGRAPLNPAGAPLAERSECAALIPLPLCRLAWRHVGGGFRTDNQLWTVDFLSKVSFPPPCGGDFLNYFNEYRITPQLLFCLEVRENHFLLLKPTDTPRWLALSRDNRSRWIALSSPSRRASCGPRWLAFLSRRTGHYLGLGSAGRTRSEGRTEPGGTQRGVFPLGDARKQDQLLSLWRLCLI